MSNLTQIIFKEADHYLTSGFGWRTYLNNGRWVTDYHEGADYGTHARNLPLYTLEGDGHVFSVGWTASTGFYIWIYYNRLKVRLGYFHMAHAAELSQGEIIRANQRVGYTGSTGNSTAIHLHLGIRDTAGKYLDPEAYAKTYSPEGGNTGGTDVPYFKIYGPMDTNTISSQMADEGVLTFIQPDGSALGYNLNGPARMALEYTEETKSPVYERLRFQEARPYEIITKSDT